MFLQKRTSLSEIKMCFDRKNNGADPCLSLAILALSIYSMINIGVKLLLHLTVGRRQLVNVFYTFS